MKKFIIIMLAVVMLLSCVTSYAMDIDIVELYIYQPVSIEYKGKLGTFNFEGIILKTKVPDRVLVWVYMCAKITTLDSNNIITIKVLKKEQV